MAYTNSNIFGIDGFRFNNQQLFAMNPALNQNFELGSTTGLYGLPSGIQQQQQQSVDGFGNELNTQQNNSENGSYQSVILCLTILVGAVLLAGAITGVVLSVVLDRNSSSPTSSPLTTLPPGTSDGNIFRYEDCGSLSPTSRILGGSNANNGEWPWMASLRDAMGNHQCGGVIISESWILTAAHCVDNTDEPILNVRFGSIEVTGFSQQSRVLQTILHDQWDPSSNNQVMNDLALLRLATPINIQNSSTVRPICLATRQRETTDYYDCHATGWGATEEPGGDTDASIYPSILQEVRVSLITTESCRAQVNNLASDLVICDGGEDDVGTCSGDSGSPLSCRSFSDTKWHLVGVVSSGVGCGKGIPAFYTRISQFISWIQLQTNTF